MNSINNLLLFLYLHTKSQYKRMRKAFQTSQSNPNQNLIYFLSFKTDEIKGTARTVTFPQLQSFLLFWEIQSYRYELNLILFFFVNKTDDREISHNPTLTLSRGWKFLGDGPIKDNQSTICLRCFYSYLKYDLNWRTWFDILVSHNVRHYCIKYNNNYKIFWILKCIE